MDDYVAKPVRPSALERALLQCVGANDNEEIESEPPIEPTLACPDTEEFDRDVDLTPKLIAMFLRFGPAQLSELGNQLLARDGEAARAQAHKLKGGLYAVGASRLADTMEELRTAIVEERWKDAHAQLGQIEPRFEAIVAALRVAVQTAQTPALTRRDVAP
jgi:HPt (histidine-containing phosphotransfer) domain-containing protein